MFTSTKVLATFCIFFAIALALPQLALQEANGFTLRCPKSLELTTPPGESPLTCDPGQSVTECCKMFGDTTCNNNGLPVRQDHADGRPFSTFCSRECMCLAPDFATDPIPIQVPKSGPAAPTLDEYKKFNAMRRANPAFAKENPEKDFTGLV
ncbi:MAG: hypothetical protein Q9221_009038 [Calogaya cf. arnoldii]